MYITAAQLNRISECHGFNRLLREDFVADGEGWSIAPVLVHQHIAGMPAAPHMRCFLKKDGDIWGLLDVSFPMLDTIRRECVKLGLARAEDVGLDVANAECRRKAKARTGVRTTVRLIKGGES